MPKTVAVSLLLFTTATGPVHLISGSVVAAGFATGAACTGPAAETSIVPATTATASTPAKRFITITPLPRVGGVRPLLRTPQKVRPVCWPDARRTFEIRKLTTRQLGPVTARRSRFPALSPGRPSLGNVRLIHTSDWHLGRAFHGVGMLPAQACYVDHLVELVRSERVDAVLVSGDVYDRALPSPGTVELLSEAVTRIVDAGAQVVLSSGNHDSAIRRGFAARLLERAGLHIRTSLASVGSPVVVDGTAIYALPYLEPSTSADHLGATDRTHAGVLRAAMERVSADLRTRRWPSVVMAHACVTGGVSSDSERDI